MVSRLSCSNTTMGAAVEGAVIQPASYHTDSSYQWTVAVVPVDSSSGTSGEGQGGDGLVCQTETDKGQQA